MASYLIYSFTYVCENILLFKSNHYIMQSMVLHLDSELSTIINMISSYIYKNTNISVPNHCS